MSDHYSLLVDHYLFFRQFQFWLRKFQRFNNGKPCRNISRTTGSEFQISQHLCENLESSGIAAIRLVEIWTVHLVSQNFTLVRPRTSPRNFRKSGLFTRHVFRRVAEINPLIQVQGWELGIAEQKTVERLHTLLQKRSTAPTESRSAATTFSLTHALSYFVVEMLWRCDKEMQDTLECSNEVVQAQSSNPLQTKWKAAQFGENRIQACKRKLENKWMDI